jgi:hypothetical protein
MANFGQHLAESLALCQQIRTKTNPICGLKTISVASSPLDILHMGLISDVEMSRWILVSHWCQVLGHAKFLDSIWLKVWHFASKSGPKLIPFAALKPYQLPPDH